MKRKPYKIMPINFSLLQKIIFFAVVFSMSILVSCLKLDDMRVDTIYKGEILDYLSAYKDIVPSDQVEKMNEFASSIDFKMVSVHQLRTTEKVIITDLKNMDGFNGSKNLKALFFLNEGKVVRANIAGFDSRTPTSEHNKLIVSVLNASRPMLSYSGKVSLFNLYRELILFNSFENGILDAVGFVRKQKSGKNNGRAESCIDWFLVTYYPNGNVTSEYVFTTCDNGCEFYRAGRTNCGGGGGSGYAEGGGPILPTNPSNDATYEYTDKNGEYTKYQYNAAAAIWKVLEKILPAAVVVAKRDEYTFLDIAWPGAYHGQIVIGTDNMVYTFGSDGNWVGEPADIEFPGVDKSPINIDAFMKCFETNNSAASYKLTLYVQEPAPGGDYQKVGTNVGHTFVGFTKIVNGQEITQYVGFYPIHKSLTYPIESKIVDNQQTEWTTSVTVTVDAKAFNDAIYAAHSNATKQYHISEYNCTTYALNIFDAANISLPKNASEFPYNYGNGYSPGRLGYDLRNFGNVFNGTKNSNGGTTANSKGPCQ